MRVTPKETRVKIVADYLNIESKVTQKAFAKMRKMKLQTLKTWLRLYRKEAEFETGGRFERLREKARKANNRHEQLFDAAETQSFKEPTVYPASTVNVVDLPVDLNKFANTVVNGMAHAVTIKLPSGAIINIPLDAPKETFEMVFSVLK